MGLQISHKSRQEPQGNLPQRYYCRSVVKCTPRIIIFLSCKVLGFIPKCRLVRRYKLVQ